MIYKKVISTNVGATEDKLFFRGEDGVLYEVPTSTISSDLSQKLSWNKGTLIGPVRLLHMEYNDGNTATYIWDDSRKKKKQPDAVVPESLFGPESSTIEYKSSLYHAANNVIDDPTNGKPAQWREIVAQLCGFGNSRKPAKVIVGVKDDGTPTANGLNEEVHDTKRVTDEFRNYTAQTVSILFAASLAFEWRDIDGKLILIISIPAWGDDVLTAFGNEVYMRSGTGTFKLKGNDMVRFIRNYPINNQQNA